MENISQSILLVHVFALLSQEKFSKNYSVEQNNSDLVLLQVMETTNTIVSWPSRLKIGAKSKKGKLIDLQSFESYLLFELFTWKRFVKFQ